MSLVHDIDNGKNISDLICLLLSQQKISESQIPGIYSAVLIDKLDYSCISINLTQSIIPKPDTTQKVKQWQGIYLHGLYYDNEGICHPFNPKSVEITQQVPHMDRHELLVLYSLAGNEKKETAIDAAKAYMNLLEGKEADIKIEYTQAPVQKPKQQKAKSSTSAAPATIKKSIPKEKSQQLGVIVTNELFHNGNVEAWKRIIESYETTYQHSKVNVYYDKKIITDLNALFEWGKVKNGTCIMFNVESPKIQNLIKLKKYLYDGASNRFERFLKGQPGQILKLF
jgi:hypothetical protein